MKFFSQIFLALAAAVLALAGCSQSSESEKPKKEGHETSQTKKQKDLSGSSSLKPPAGGLKGIVIQVLDGDMIAVKLTSGKTETVHLALVDTPDKKQPYGKEAFTFTSTNLTAREVTLETDAQERDKEGNLLAYVWSGDKLFNEILLQQGFAKMTGNPPNAKYKKEFSSVETKVRKAKTGIWSI
ncbi:thermonuclease family protein, partial [Peribacillus kribbensis]|uniref:thermonuclease family protein n=1 Tax=Peribacillus kribbensis TaxID=356658 RepID=UPI0003F4B701